MDNPPRSRIPQSSQGCRRTCTGQKGPGGALQCTGEGQRQGAQGAGDWDWYSSSLTPTRAFEENFDLFLLTITRLACEK